MAIIFSILCIEKGNLECSSQVDPMYYCTCKGVSAKRETLFPSFDLSNFLSITTSQGEASLSNRKFLGYVNIYSIILYELLINS